MSDLNHNWHVAINKFAMEVRKTEKGWPHFMYEAKDLANESKRLAILFRKEREGKLGKVHRQCSMSPLEPIEDNHLTCCLGTECRKCEYLLALDKAENLTPDQIDEIKAWTCCAHVLTSGGDLAQEGYILTVGDRMFWDRVYRSMSEPEPEVADCTRHYDKWSKWLEDQFQKLPSLMIREKGEG